MQYYIVKKKRKKETEGGHSLWTSRTGEETVVFSETWLSSLSQSELGGPGLGSLAGVLRVTDGQHTHCTQDGNPLLSFRLGRGSAETLPSPTSPTWLKCSEEGISVHLFTFQPPHPSYMQTKRYFGHFSVTYSPFTTIEAWFLSLLSQPGYHLAGVVVQRNKGGNCWPVSSSNTRANYMPISNFPSHGASVFFVCKTGVLFTHWFISTCIGRIYRIHKVQ